MKRANVDLVTPTDEGGSLIMMTSGKSMEVPYNAEMVCRSLGRWLGGELIQDAFPYMTPDQREFLITGITPEEWVEIFGED